MKYLLYLLIVFTLSCGKKTSKAAEKHLNITVLLDLSDRIKRDDQIRRDKEVVALITDFFKSHIKNTKLLPIQIKSRLSIQVFHQNESENHFAKYAKNLQIDFENAISKRQKTKEVKDVKDSVLYACDTLKKYVEKLYEESSQNLSFQGAHIRDFFEHDMHKYIKSDTSFRNILVILTDGYYIVEDKNHVYTGNGKSLYMSEKMLQSVRNQGDDYQKYMASKNIGLAPNSDNSIKNIEILALEFNPYSNTFPHEYEMLKYIWEDWFCSMNVKTSSIHRSQSASTGTDLIIKDFFSTQNKNITDCSIFIPPVSEVVTSTTIPNKPKTEAPPITNKNNPPKPEPKAKTTTKEVPISASTREDQAYKWQNNINTYKNRFSIKEELQDTAREEIKYQLDVVLDYIDILNNDNYYVLPSRLIEYTNEVKGAFNEIDILAKNLNLK